MALLLLNLAFFAVITSGAVLAAVLGWKVVREESADSGPEGGSAVYASCIGPRLPGGFPTRRAGRNDLARCA
jgi:hypothetical protein